jgi:DNA-binding NtrC family response regulator
MTIRILIVDDELHWINFAQDDLGGFEIVVARSRDEALKFLEENKFDLVIASSRRLDVLGTIAEKYSDKRVVVTTVRPTPEEAITAYRLGALRYFAKSFRRSDLLARVSEVISIPASTG